MTVCTVTVCCYADKMPVKMLLGVLGEATYFPHGWQSQIENEKLWNTSPSTQPHIRLWVSLMTMLEAVGTQHRETEHSYPPGRSGSTLSAHHWSPFLLTIFWLKYSWFTVLAHQAPLPMGFSRQEYWSGVPLLSTEEFMLLTCGVGEDSCKSLGLQGDPTSPF